MRFNIEQFKNTFQTTALNVIANEFKDSGKECTDSDYFDIFLKVVKAELFKYDIINIDDFTKDSIVHFIRNQTGLKMSDDAVFEEIRAVVSDVELKQEFWLNKSVDLISDLNDMDIDVSGELTKEDLDTNIEAHNCHVEILKPRIKEIILNKYSDVKQRL